MSFIVLTRARYWMLRNAAIGLMSQSRLKIIVILFASIGCWLGMYALFSSGYRFLARFPDISVDWMMEYLFGILFFALTLMLVISNAIISFSGLYKSRETEFLLPRPISAGSLFSYKLLESIAFSSWAFVFLITPLLFAYGINHHLPFSFYPLSVAFMMVYLLLPAVVGSFIALVIARFLPRRRREILLAVLLIALVVVLALWNEVAKIKGLALPFTTRWMQELMGKFSFTQNPLLPSYWLVQGVMGAARADMARIVFFGLFLLAQSAFAIVLITVLARRWYLPSYSRMQSSRRTRKYPVFGWLDRLGKALTFWLSQPLQQIILKDLKSLLRDPVQWSQSLVFFGLLGVYFINLRNLPYISSGDAFWQYLVSFLNLLATSLTLATFTTRFIYPQLSLEGQRFWVIGLAPISRRTIIYGKFFFALIGSLLISEALILLSNWMLRSPLIYTLIQAYTVLIICLGLSALAVGFGAMYPNLKEDNPSKIVAGFGGTLTLVVSMIFVLGITVLEAAPPHLYYAFHFLTEGEFHFWWFVATALVTLLGLLVMVLPLHYGIKAIERMEV